MYFTRAAVAKRETDREVEEQTEEHNTEMIHSSCCGRVWRQGGGARQQEKSSTDIKDIIKMFLTVQLFTRQCLFIHFCLQHNGGI